jgi:crotonobetainyl-CoA:carnitine CoA-transferase CaiB-like acyl-CoA transferase
VLDVKEMHADEQTRARAMVVETHHSTLGTVETIGLPVKFSSTPGGVARGAPVYGEHTREVLREHGFADAEIDALARAGAIHVGEAKVAAE